MPRRILIASRGGHHIKQWRVYRGLSLAEVAERLGSSPPSLSRVERGLQPYTQDVLEGLAAVFQCRPQDLIARNPSDPIALIDVWSEATPARRRFVTRLARVLLTRMEVK